MSPMHLSRRSFVKLGLGSLAAALTLRELGASAVSAGPKAAAKRVIVLWMNGGASHLDTFDPKPGTKAGGSFKAIRSRAPGLSLSEHLPLLADRATELAVLRGVSSNEGSHPRAQELGHTGFSPSPTVAAPAFGSYVARALGASAGELPPFVSLGGPSAGPGFLGASYAPLVVDEPGLAPKNLVPVSGVGAEREARRISMLDALEARYERDTGDAKVRARRDLYARAVRLAKSPKADLFDVSSEPEAIKRAYGDTGFGRGCLVARRLVEAGVPFVEVALDGWDTHQNNFARVRSLSGALDAGMASLLRELGERDLLSSTLVVWMTEFGRSPRITGDDGRDHHPAAFSVVMAGGGVRGGVVHGETDAEGAEVKKGKVRVADVLATMASCLGLDPAASQMTSSGRPLSLTDRGKPIGEVLASA
jgi:uncharacterized protein (DUF1501 family)